MKRDLARWFNPSQACLHGALASCIDRHSYFRIETLAGRAANLEADVYRHRRKVLAVCYPPQPKLAVVVGHNEGERPGVDAPGHAQPNHNVVALCIQ
jgi:hypothetical protein